MKKPISELKPLLHRIKFSSEDYLLGSPSKGTHEATVVEVVPVGINHWRVRTPGYWHKIHHTHFEYELVEDEPENELESKPLGIPVRQLLVRGRSID